MHYRMHDSLSWCAGQGRAIFMDLATDRYFRLRPEDDRNFQKWAQSGKTIGFDPLDLVRAGVLIPCSEPQPPRAATQVPTPSVDLAEDAGTRAHFADIVRGLAAQRHAAFVVRRGRLSEMVDAIRTGDNRPVSPDGEMAVRRVAAAFASMPLSLRKSGQCLPRALAAHALCRRLDVRPTLVFGVRLEPFAAHCWLQLGPKIIVGDLQQARMFTAILAVP